MTQHLERLDLLAPIVRAPMRLFISAAEARQGVVFFVVFTWRSLAEQQRLYQQGRTFDREQGIWMITDAKRVVTRARPGLSAHNVVTASGRPAALAADLMPIRNGQIHWIADEAFWRPLYDLAWDHGLDPLGDATGSYLAGDWGHFEEPGWKHKLDALGLVRPQQEEEIVV